MKATQLQQLIELIKQSQLTVIGYLPKNEKIKNQFISNFSYLEIKEPFLCPKQAIRNLKIKSILENKKLQNTEYILLDINNLIFQHHKDSEIHQKSRALIYKLRDTILTDDSNQTNTKIIITCPLYERGHDVPVVRSDKSVNDYNFIGGSGVIYTCDLTLTIVDNKINIIKNRLNNILSEIPYNIETNQL